MNPTGYALLVLFAINLMNFFDRQIIGGVGEGIRREWGLSDTALGLLGTVFTLLYAVVGLPLGRLSDRTERRRILAAGVFVWSLLTALSGVARNFATVDRRAARRRRRRGDVLAGVHVAHRRPRFRRPGARAPWRSGCSACRSASGLANGAGGWILQNWGWRNAFYVAAVPGILCAIAALMIREPRARDTRGARGRRPPPSRAIRTCSCCRFRRSLWIIVSGALHNFNMYALGSFVAPFLVRFHHMNFLDAGWVAAAVYGFSGIVGLTGGGALADRLYRRRVDGRLIVGTGVDRHLRAADVSRPDAPGRRHPRASRC